jgi:hypothetical protein
MEFLTYLQFPKVGTLVKTKGCWRGSFLSLPNPFFGTFHSASLRTNKLVLFIEILEFYFNFRNKFQLQAKATIFVLIV